MIIYTDNENRIVKSGINAFQIPENHPIALMSETKRLCYVYEENGSFYPYVSTDIIDKLEKQEVLDTQIQLAITELAEMIGG